MVKADSEDEMTASVEAATDEAAPPLVTTQSPDLVKSEKAEDDVEQT
jgi:hypothetical protein